jgi:hypothetical protein
MCNGGIRNSRMAKRGPGAPKEDAVESVMKRIIMKLKEYVVKMA